MKIKHVREGIKLPTSVGSLKNQENSRKTFTFPLLTTLKPLTVWITTNYGTFWTFWKRWEYQTTLPTSWEICLQVKKQQLELDMEQQTGSKSGKEYIKAVYCHPAYLTYMQGTSWETLGWRKHWVEFPVLYSQFLSVIYFMHSSVYTSVPVHPLPLSPFGDHTFVLYVCFSICFANRFIQFFRFHIFALIYLVCFSLSDLYFTLYNSRSIHVGANGTILFLFMAE